MSAPRPTYCCGVCPETPNGYDCTCQNNPRCKLTQPNPIKRWWNRKKP